MEALSKQTKVNINKRVKSVYQSCAGCCALNKHKQNLKQTSKHLFTCKYLEWLTFYLELYN